MRGCGGHDSCGRKSRPSFLGSRGWGLTLTMAKLASDPQVLALMMTVERKGVLWFPTIDGHFERGTAEAHITRRSQKRKGEEGVMPNGIGGWGKTNPASGHDPPRVGCSPRHTPLGLGVNPVQPPWDISESTVTLADA